MSFYCGCQTRTLEGKEPLNDFVKESKKLERIVLPTRPMVCIKVGAEQFLATGHPHYPNVDIFECSACGMRVVRE